MTVNKPMLEVMAKLEKRAIADHVAYVGRILLCRVVSGYNEKDDSVEVSCNPPARVRVQRASNHDLEHWNDNWLDPYWDIELVEPHPALQNIRSLWTFGLSYCTDGRTEPCSEWVAEKTTLVQRLRDAVRRRL